MMKISIAFLAAMSIAGSGCHKNKDKNQAGESIAKLTEIKNKMCACKDKTCSEKVSAELVEWSQAQEKSAGDKPASVSEGDSEKIEEVKDEISQCLLKLELPGGSGAAGAAGGAGGTMAGGNPAAGSADGSAAAGGRAGGAAAGGAGGSAPPAAGSAAAGSAH